MKTLGIVGGVGPESTIEYYRRIMEAYQKQAGADSQPHLVINSVDVNRALSLIRANELDAFAKYFIDAVNLLADAGAHFALISANTPHVVFDDIAHAARIPLLSIVQATCDAAKNLRLNRLALLGTSFTMQGRFYPDVFSKDGIAIVTPPPAEQSYIHDIYINELLKGIVRQEVRDKLVAIVSRMKREDGIDGLILGGTELSLILKDSIIDGIPVLDTTQIHVNAAVSQIFGI